MGELGGARCRGAAVWLKGRGRRVGNIPRSSEAREDSPAPPERGERPAPTVDLGRLVRSAEPVSAPLSLVAANSSLDPLKLSHTRRRSYERQLVHSTSTPNFLVSSASIVCESSEGQLYSTASEVRPLTASWTRRTSSDASTAKCKSRRVSRAEEYSTKPPGRSSSHSTRETLPPSPSETAAPS